MKRRLTPIFVAISLMVFSFCLLPLRTASAAVLNDVEKDSVIDVMSFVEPQKASFGLEDVNFREIAIGEPVKAYEYIDDGFSFVGNYYPLFFENNLVAFAIDTGDGQFQIETKVANSLSRFNGQGVTLLFDAESCYAWTGQSLNGLFSFGEPISDRGYLDQSAALLLSSDDITTLEPTESIGYAQKPSNRASAYILNVSYVTQKPYGSLCWAATIACITNYYKGTSYTAPQIANMYQPGYTSSLAFGTAVSQLSLRSGKSYTAYYSAPSESTIETNLARGYPIYGSFNVYGLSNTHAGTIYGVDTVNDYILVMDPNSGSVTAKFSGTYKYTASSGRGCTLARAGRVL